MNQGYVMNSWYDISGIETPPKTFEDIYARYNQKELMQSVETVTKKIDEEEKLLGRSQKVFLGGFS